MTDKAPLSATEPCDLSAVEARRLIGAKALSPVELLQSCLDRIAAVDPALNALPTVDADGAMAAAKEAEAAVVAGAELGALHGLPIAIKDNRAVKGMRTTHGSLIYKDLVPDADETGVARLRAAGGIIFAKSNLPEFGAGANTTNRVFGPTGNPFDPSKTSAGSSGGSAAALAAGMTTLATGSDYGGSLRTPAAFCGVSGFRPSLGVAPAYDNSATLSPFGVNGPMGRSVADAHLLLTVQADYDVRDPFSHPGVYDAARPLFPADLGALKIAASPDLGCAPVDRDIATLFHERVALFSALFGGVEAAHPDMGDVHRAFEITRGLTFVAAHRERLEQHRDLLDRNVIDNTERGLQYSLGDVAWAQTELTRIYRRWLRFFDEYDALILPAASVSPFPHSQLFVEEINGEKMPTYMRWLALSYGTTMAFAPVCAIPCGLDKFGMPFGVMIAGRQGDDAKILSIAHALELALAEIPEARRPIPNLDALKGAAS